MDIKIKRISALALTVVLMLGFCACGSPADRDTEDDTELSFSSLEVSPDDGSELPSVTSVNYPSSFTVLCEKGREGDMFSSADETDILAKNIFERNANLFEQYGITLESVVSEDIVTKATNDMLSEDREYDMLLLSALSSASLITSGVLADLGSVAGWSASLSGYAERVIEELSVCGRTFLAAGDATPSLFLSASAVLVNTEISEKVGGTEKIFSVAENGRFTYDVMLEYSSAVSELGGNDSSVYNTAAIRVGAEDAINLFLSGGGRFFEVDSVTDVPSAENFEGELSNIYTAVMSLFGIDENVEEQETVASSSVTPLFNVASIGELYSLVSEDTPFAVLPMPKKDIIQKEYYCNIDMTKATFTALPRGSGETEVAVMNLIYALSDGIMGVILDACGAGNSKGAELVRESMGAQVLDLFGFGDIPAFMASCVNERTTAKVFAMRASERSTAGVSALSIVADKYSSAN